MPTEVRSRMCRVAKLKIGDELFLDPGWAIVTDISNSGGIRAVTCKRGGKTLNFPMFETRAVRIIRR